MGNKYSDDELLEEIKRLKCKYNETPSAHLMNDEGEFSSRTYQLRFGSWNEAVEKAGLDVNYYNKIEERELISELERLDKCTDSRVDYHDLEKSCYSIQPFCTAFGSWTEALKEANLPTKDFSGQNNPRWSGGYEGWYGESWEKAKEEVRKRDGNVCRVCSLSNKEHIEHYQYPLNVHHIKPARDFENTTEQDHIVNSPDNLITLCRTCHNEVERMFVDCKPDEFERRAKEYMGIETTSVEDSVFDY